MTETASNSAQQTVALPDRAIELLEGPNFGHLATVMPDGSPQVTPVWVATDGRHVLINTARGRTKLRNLERNSNVAIEILDSQNPYSYVQVRGYVAELTTEGAVDLINELHRKYHGSGQYPLPPGQVRVTVKIAPVHVDVH